MPDLFLQMGAQFAHAEVAVDRGHQGLRRARVPGRYGATGADVRAASAAPRVPTAFRTDSRDQETPRRSRCSQIAATEVSFGKSSGSSSMSKLSSRATIRFTCASESQAGSVFTLLALSILATSVLRVLARISRSDSEHRSLLSGSSFQDVKIQCCQVSRLRRIDHDRADRGPIDRQAEVAVKAGHRPARRRMLRQKVFHKLVLACRQILCIQAIDTASAILAKASRKADSARVQSPGRTSAAYRASPPDRPPRSSRAPPRRCLRKCL